jgi:hypothetical protein
VLEMPSTGVIKIGYRHQERGKALLVSQWCAGTGTGIHLTFQQSKPALVSAHPNARLGIETRRYLIPASGRKGGAFERTSVCCAGTWYRYCMYAR